MKKCNICGTERPAILPDCFICVPGNVDDATWEAYQEKKERDLLFDEIPKKLVKALMKLDFIKEQYKNTPDFKIDLSKERIQSGEIVIYSVLYVQQLETQVKTLEAIVDKKDGGNDGKN